MLMKENIRFTCRYASPLGEMRLASDGEALTGAWFVGQKYDGAGLPDRLCERMVAPLEETREWLDCYFGGGRPGFMPAVHLCGTPFRLAVWEVLRRIPYGETVTYGGIAAELVGRHGLSSMSAQAVGGAVGHNPVSIIIPCHRVVGAGGSLTGYAGGLERKRCLLQLEHVVTERLRMSAAE